MNSPEKKATRARNIRELWDALLSPNWTSDDLIYLGKAIYARTPLKNFDPTKFDRILPHLAAVVEQLETKITPVPAALPSNASETPAGPSAPTEPSPVPTALKAPEGKPGKEEK